MFLHFCFAVVSQSLFVLCKHPMSALSELARPHIESFNALFSNSVIDNIVANMEGVEIRDESSSLKVFVEDVTVLKPFLSEKDYGSIDRRFFPCECRERQKTYRGRIIIKYGFFLNGERFHSEERNGGYMPIMLRSALCHLSSIDSNKYPSIREDKEELGGYFIVNGIEKLVRFLIIQKRNFVFAHNKSSYLKKGKNLTEHAVSIRCVGNDEIASMMHIHYAQDGNVYVRVFYRKSEYIIPIVPVLKCLVNVTDEELFRVLCYKEDNLLKCKIELLLRKSADLSMSCIANMFREAFIGQSYTESEIGELFLKRCIAVQLDTKQDKYNFLIEATKKLLSLVEGKIQQDDPDNPMNHEILSTTQLFALIIKERLEETLRAARIVYLKKGFPLTKQSILENLVRKFDVNIGHKIENFLATGNYNTVHSTDIMQSSGFSVVAERLNFYRFLSHFRCVSRGAFFATVKITTVRKLRPESWGFFCPVHTPDGAPCGLLNHLAHSACIVFRNEDFDPTFLFRLGMVECRIGMFMKNTFPVALDGRVVGYAPEHLAAGIARAAREHRNRNNSAVEVVYIPGSVCMSPGIFIFTSIGRLARPVFNNVLSSVEYIGIMEQVFLNISLEDVKEDAHTEHTAYRSTQNVSMYREIAKTNIFSVLAGLTPFSDHNQSPRNMHQCQMAKQSIGVPFLNTKYRVDNKSYHLVYTQDPVVKTHFYDMYNLSSYPIGINAVVAVLSYTAYDMEDAMVINRSSIDRGFFKGEIYKTETVNLEKDCHVMDMPDIGDIIDTDDVILRYKDSVGDMHAIRYKGLEAGCVDSVRLFSNQSVSPLINTAVVRLRIKRDPTIGDKFCSRHGQKGVCSMRWPNIDMPFSESGLVPDIIINPHAFPSRMTIGMLLESIAGKSGCLLGKKQDSTPFQQCCSDRQMHQSKEDMRKAFCEELQKHGFNYYGNEPMYSGITGQELRTDIYLGVVYYQRLRHMVNDKFQVRSTGPVQPQTRQPIKGRSKQGGVRLGEMERDAIIGHGASYILQDRLMNCSDGCDFFYCKSCRSIMCVEKSGCTCGTKEIYKVRLPYVIKYLLSELLAMNIRVRLNYD